MRWLVIRLIFVVLFCFVLPFPSLLSRCLDSVERNVIYWLYFSSLEFMIQKSRKIVQKNLGHNDSVRCIIHIPERSQVLL